MASQTSTRSCAVYCLGRSPPSSRRRGTVAARRSRPTGSAPCRARSLGATSLIIAACSGAWLARLHRLPIMQRSARSRENLVASAARRRRHDGAAPSRLGARMAYGLGAVARADARRHVPNRDIEVVNGSCQLDLNLTDPFVSHVEQGLSVRTGTQNTQSPYVTHSYRGQSDVGRRRPSHVNDSVSTQERRPLPALTQSEHARSARAGQRGAACQDLNKKKSK